MKRRKFVKDSAIVGATIATPQIIKANSGLLSNDNARTVHKILNADRTKVGTLPILRAFAGDHLDYVSPFVLFDEFGPVSVNPGDDPLRVDAHPHAGVIPTTYFLAGNGHHKDSLDYDIQIGKGDFMMFSSGKGAIHMEETGQDLFDNGGSYHGFQIWLNMPAAHKFSAPATYVYRDDHLDQIEHDDYSIKVILGQLFDAKSKIEMLSPAFYYHVKLNENGKLSIPTEASHNAFIYTINGEAELANQTKIKANQIALYERNASDIEIFTECGVEFLLLGGEILNERVYSYGPFVMNNEDQIRQCMKDYRDGKMGNPDLVN